MVMGTLAPSKQGGPPSYHSHSSLRTTFVAIIKQARTHASERERARADYNLYNNKVGVSIRER